jgi:hypothetical protein
MTTHGNSTEEEFEVVKFIENNASFGMLLGKTWIEKYQTRRKEEEALEQKKKHLREFMAKRITHLPKEQENQSKLLRTINLNVEVEITQEDLKHLSVQ